jgi:tetratricopeptide (TPR) repeat protein
MPKPERRINTPSDEMARFTDREDQQAIFHRHLFSTQEPPVLVFYGVGGTGKTWLLRKLRSQLPADIPFAYLDFDIAANGGRFVSDPATALQSIRQQLAAPAPRFDLALSMLRHKQGAPPEPGMWLDVAAELVGNFVPGGGTVLKILSKHALSRIKGTDLEKLLSDISGSQLVKELRAKTDQEIGNELIYYLADDLRAALPVHLQRAVSCVIFLDTFEAVGSGFQNEEHKRSQEEWIRKLASEFNFALTVIAGQNRLFWDEVDPNWASNLDQHIVGGLSAEDARHFLADCGIISTDLQASILSTSKESTGGYHCFSLGLCADIVANERRGGNEPTADTLRFNPQDWENIARRFLKSLLSDSERRWIERLALTPRFDEDAARWAYSSGRSASQDAAWEGLHSYSFVERISGGGWSSIRTEMRSALKNQPSAQERAKHDHQLWKDYWSGRSEAVADDAAGLAWYHSYYLDPEESIGIWGELVESARTSVPARMREHSRILGWLEPLMLLEIPPRTQVEANTLGKWGVELSESSLSEGLNRQKSIACCESALQVYTERAFPQEWAGIQNLLGIVWGRLFTGDQTANCKKAIAYYEAALRVFTEQEFPGDWAWIQSNIGYAWGRMPIGDRTENLKKVMAYNEAALRVFTEQEFPLGRAHTSCILGGAWGDLPTGDRTENCKKAIAYYEAALRFYTEQEFPRDWARIQNHLGGAWSGLPTGDRTENLKKAIAYNEAALRVFTEQEFPSDWATCQRNLGGAWSSLPTGDRTENLKKAIAYNEAALRVLTEQEFPSVWATCQSNLGGAWSRLPTDDRTENLKKAIAYYEAALRIYTEHEFPQNWARAQNNLGGAWGRMLIGDRTENLKKAIAYYEAALRVLTEQEFPSVWATCQSNLGGAWSRLPTDDQAVNIKNAIVFLEAALRVFTEQEFPHDWALAQNNLGGAWGRMLIGDRTENLKKAIAYYEAALRVLTEQEFPSDWATCQRNLGGAWRDLPTGDRTENLKKAIAYYEAALRVFTEQEFPSNWATCQSDLGGAWRDLPTGDRTENLKKAIAYYEAALRVFTEQEFPSDWATCQRNLGGAWSSLPTDDRTENLKKAIAYYEAALRIYTEHEFPQNWACAKNDLGVAWIGIPTDDRAENYKKAMACYEAALRVFTEQAFQHEHEVIVNNIRTLKKLEIPLASDQSER